MHYERTLITLSTMWHGSHIRRICLQHYALQRHCCGQSLWQFTFLERRHTTYTEHESIKGEQLGSLIFIARKAVKDTAMQPILELTQRSHHLVLRLTAVYHQRHRPLNSPPYLSLKSLTLLTLILMRPIIVQSYLADSYPLCIIEMPFHLIKHLRPVRLDILRMQSYHAIAIAIVALGQRCHTAYIAQVDARHEKTYRTCRPGTSYNVVKVIAKLLAIDVCMSINEVHNAIYLLRFIIFRAYSRSGVFFSSATLMLSI